MISGKNICELVSKMAYCRLPLSRPVNDDIAATAYSFAVGSNLRTRTRARAGGSASLLTLGVRVE